GLAGRESALEGLSREAVSPLAIAPGVPQGLREREPEAGEVEWIGGWTLGELDRALERLHGLLRAPEPELTAANAKQRERGKRTLGAHRGLDHRERPFRGDHRLVVLLVGDQQIGQVDERDREVRM